MTQCKCMSGDVECGAPVHRDGLCVCCHAAGCVSDDRCRASVWYVAEGERTSAVEWTGVQWEECTPDGDCLKCEAKPCKAHMCPTCGDWPRTPYGSCGCDEADRDPIRIVCAE